MYIHVQVEARVSFGCCASGTLHLVFLGPLIALELALSPSPALRLQTHATTPCFVLVWVLGIELGPLSLCSKHITNWAVSLAPRFRILG